MEINRDYYLKKLIERKGNGLINVITGIRRCGKSYLMNTIFYRHLVSIGVPEDHIIRFAFDSADDLLLIGENPINLEKENRKVDPEKFAAYIRLQITDLGLRNARINFRQFEQNHIMENVIYNELRMRGYCVDIGVVPVAEKGRDGKVFRKQLEVDFVCNLGNCRYYIQSAYSIPDEEKRVQEIRPFHKIDDSFKKIVITEDVVPSQYDNYGILTINIFDFLLDPDALEH